MSTAKERLGLLKKLTSLHVFDFSEMRILSDIKKKVGEEASSDDNLVVDILASITWESNDRQLNWGKTEEKIRKLLQGKK